MSVFVPKNRRPKFALTLKIFDLNNVPLVSGNSFVKWWLPHSQSAEHRGRTDRYPVKDHKVEYNYTKELDVRMVIDSSGVLRDSHMHFEVIQEYGGNSRGDRIPLGDIKLNLAEYVEASELEAEEEGGVVRRYLMQNSKINSTLKIGIMFKLIEGERGFTAPQLKTAPVFTGIAGIIAEQGDADESAFATLTSKSREQKEIQDLYRLNLAASWAAMPGELRADECIENIFHGGDGWPNSTKKDNNTNSNGTHLAPNMNRTPEPESAGTGRRSWDSGTARDSGHMRTRSRSRDGRLAVPKPHDHHPHHQNHEHLHPDTSALFRQNSTASREQRHQPSWDVDELEVRENLRSWTLPEPKSVESK